MARLTILAAALAAALGGTQTSLHAAAADADPRLSLFLQTLRGHPPAEFARPNPLTAARLEQVLRILPAVAIGHGSDAPLSQRAPGAAPSPPALSSYAFCYEACRTERALGSCGKPGLDGAPPPRKLCDPIEDSATLRAIIGPPLGTGASPFVDDNTGPDGSQPAGYTFLGQFIDHDVTRTATALQALDTLNQAAQTEPAVARGLAAAGITPALLHEAVADAANPASALSVNTGKLDLDSVYGVADFATLTTIAAPWFEQRNGLYTGRFALTEIAAPSATGAAGVIDGLDFIRAANGSAEIPDPRNSEHKMISQLQALFELAHNDCIDRTLAAVPAPSQAQIAAAFDDCHRRVVWTYETIVATDFLPRILAEAALARIAPGALHAYERGAAPNSTLPAPGAVHTFLYRCRAGLGARASIPIPHEFAVAAFRLGHSLVRDDYRLHEVVRDASGAVLTGQPRPIFAAADQPATVGLVGDNPLAPADVIDWSYFFDFGGATAQAVRPLDTLISDKLFSLPIAALPPGPDANGKDTSSERNLPRRNLLRASEPSSVLTGSVGLATGEEAERYAQARIPDLHDATAAVRRLLAQRLEGAGFPPDAFARRTPLWLFVLAEAETTQNSRRLGELGSHLVGEFLLGSLRCDLGSVLYANAAELRGWGWGPTATIAHKRRYSMPELIAYLQANAVVAGRSVRLTSR